MIEFLGTIIESDLLSPFDNYLITNFIQLTQHALGDVVRCALAHVWNIILIKTTTHQQQYQFSFGININHDSLLTILIAQIPLLIGDGGHQTEIQCLRLIESIAMKNKDLDNVLEFLHTDGCSNEIKDKAGRLLSIKTGLSKKQMKF